MRSILLASLLLCAGATGCLSGVDEPGQDGTQSVTEIEICKVTDRSGTVTSDEDLVVDTSVGQGPVTAHVEVSSPTSEGVGKVTLVLEHEGDRIWRDSSPEVGTWNTTRTLQDLEPGSYTLTASTDTGQRDVDTTLKLTVGNPSC